MQIRVGYFCLSLVLITSTALPCASLGASLGASLAQTGDEGSDKHVQASVYWNKTARDLVAANKLDPVTASKVYAFLSIAQNDAIALTRNPLSDASEKVIDAAARDAAATASAAVLSEFFPSNTAEIQAAHESFAEAGIPETATGQAHADRVAIGHAVAERVLTRARGDGSDEPAGDIVVPAGPGLWRADPDRRPLLPYWGQVRPLLMDSVDDFVAEPPPAVESASFRSALAEVSSLSDRLDSQQLELVHFWADGPGTATPAGHWNELAAELILAHGLSEQSAARTFALLNLALFDAGIACWKAKYTYWLARPNQMDADIKPAIAVPHFPSYTSGHASFSGAAGEVLSYLFPDEAERIRALAEEAAISRVHAGIHFPFDSEKGLEVGRRVGRLAAELNEHPGELLPHLK